MRSKRNVIWFTVLLLCMIGIDVDGQQERPSSPVLGKCYSHRLSSPQSGMLAANRDSIYVGSTNGVLSSYVSRDLAPEWRLELGGEFGSDILALDDGPVVVTNPIRSGQPAADEATIRLIAGKTGVTSWAAKLPFSEKYYLGRSTAGIAIISREGLVTILEQSGQLVSRNGPYGIVTAKPVFKAGRIAFGTGNKQLIVISGQSGGSVTKIALGMIPRAVAFSKKDDLIVGGERGNLEHVELESGGASWKFKTGAAVSSIVNTDEGILVTSLDNFVYLISDYNGNVIWKRRLSGRILDGGLSLAGYFVVLINGENSGYALDLANGKIADVFTSVDSDLISGSPVPVRVGAFAVTTTGSFEIYAVGGCAAKS